MLMKEKLITITLERIYHWDDSEALKIAALNYPFVIEVDKENSSKMNIIQDGKILTYFEFETASQCSQELSYISGIFSGEDNWNPHFNEYGPMVINLTWNDRELEAEREALVKERKELWENCDCEGDEGCEKCTKNPKFELKYAKPFNQF